ncbi:MAG: GTPase [Actinomycetota bacterium]
MKLLGRSKNGGGEDAAPRTAQVAEAADALAEAVELAEGRLPQDSVELARQIVAKTGERLRHGSDHTLVAVLGATGGGKSSLTNALVGDDVATTGVRRPTTTSTLACHWGDDDPHPLLDWLEIVNRHAVTPAAASGAADDESADATDGGPSLDGLILLDVPDHDSVEIANRLEMERIAEHADLLLWVTDPEKYADLAMHAYLARLSAHGAVMAMVLNKADTLRPDQMGHCRADLMLLLQDVGLYEPEVLTASATSDPPQIDAVRDLLARAVADRRAMTDRLRADIGHAAGELLADLGGDDAATNTVSSKTADNLARELVDAAGLEPVCDAVAAGHRRDAAAAAGWPFTRWVRRLRPHPLRRLRLQEGSTGRSSLPEASGIQKTRTDGAIRTAVADTTAELADPWPDLVRDAATPDQAELHDRLDGAVSGAVRSYGSRRPRWWSVINVVQLILAVAVVVGLVWLGLLAVAAYLQLPDIPTPSYRRIPVPTGLAVGGALIGLLLAFLARRLAVVGARRRRGAVRKAATDAVGEVADDLVMEPMRRELAKRGELHERLTDAVEAATPSRRDRRRRR